MSNGNKEQGGNIALLFVFWLKDPGGHLFTGCCPNHHNNSGLTCLFVL